MVNKKILLSIALLGLFSSFTFAKQTKTLVVFSNANSMQAEYDNNQKIFIEKYKDKKIQVNSINLNEIKSNDASITTMNKKVAHMHEVSAYTTGNNGKLILFNTIDYKKADADKDNLLQGGQVVVKVTCDSLSIVNTNVLKLNNCIVI